MKANCHGLKLAGAGGFGYMIIVSEKPIANGIKITSMW
tara:strand:+ start:218 stop:331 length:114 start_codon:yes stop_codon:yes gene_type:complete